MSQRRRSIKPKTAPKRHMSDLERRTVERLLSMQTTAAFRSQLEMEYRNHNLNRVVLYRLFRCINSASIRMQKKRAMLKIATGYNQLV